MLQNIHSVIALFYLVSLELTYGYSITVNSYTSIC